MKSCSNKGPFFYLILLELEFIFYRFNLRNSLFGVDALVFGKSSMKVDQKWIKYQLSLVYLVFVGGNKIMLTIFHPFLLQPA